MAIFVHTTSVLEYFDLWLVSSSVCRSCKSSSPTISYTEAEGYSRGGHLKCIKVLGFAGRWNQRLSYVKHVHVVLRYISNGQFLLSTAILGHRLASSLPRTPLFSHRHTHTHTIQSSILQTQAPVTQGLEGIPNRLHAASGDMKHSKLHNTWLKKARGEQMTERVQGNRVGDPYPALIHSVNVERHLSATLHTARAMKPTSQGIGYRGGARCQGTGARTSPCPLLC